MSSKVFMQRLRQIEATDINALDIYRDLYLHTEDRFMKEQLEVLIKDEVKHGILAKAMLGSV